MGELFLLCNEVLPDDFLDATEGTAGNEEYVSSVNLNCF